MDVELVTEGPIPVLVLAQIMGLDYELPSQSSLSEDDYRSFVCHYITDLWEQIYTLLINVEHSEVGLESIDNSERSQQFISSSHISGTPCEKSKYFHRKNRNFTPSREDINRDHISNIISKLRTRSISPSSKTYDSKSVTLSIKHTSSRRKYTSSILVDSRKYQLIPSTAKDNCRASEHKSLSPIRNKTARVKPLIAKDNESLKKCVLLALNEIASTLSGRKVNAVAKQINNSYSQLSHHKNVHSIVDIENIIQTLAEEGYIFLNRSKKRFVIELPTDLPEPKLKFIKENLISIVTEMSHQLSNVTSFEGAVKVLVNSYSKWAPFDRETRRSYAQSAVYSLLKMRMLT